MARFWVEAQGSRGSVKRLGGAGTGADTTAAGWDGAIRCELYDVDGVDYVRVVMGKWRGHGESPDRMLYQGPLGEFNPDPDCECGKVEAQRDAALV